MNIIAFAIRRWQFTLLIFAMMVASGLFTLLTIPRSMDPHFPIPIVIIKANLPGADPTDMEQLVAKPIEDVLQGLDDVKEITSSNGDGSSFIKAEFTWDTDADRKYDEVVREISAIRSTLPAALQKLEFTKARTTNAAIVQLSLVSETASPRRFDKIARDLRDRLNKIEGVRNAFVFGVPPLEVRVAVDMGRLAALKLPVTRIADALRTQGADLPVGAVHVGDRRFNVKAGGAFHDLEAINATPVLSAASTVVRVRDVATVSWAQAEPLHVTTYNGKRAVFVTATQKNGANLVAIRNAIYADLDQFEKQLPPDIKLERGFDQSEVVTSRLNHLGVDFLIALGLVMITLLPLGWRAATVVMISIPLSLAIALSALNALGFTLNQLSIAGFILSLGILVDDSIVVTENIARHMRSGEPREQAALSATRQIAVAVLGCTATLMLAFLPLMFLPEGSGRFILSLPVTVLLTVGASLLVSLTIMPFLASRILPKTSDAHGNALLQNVMKAIHGVYRPVLHAALARPTLTLLLAGLLCALSFSLVPRLGLSLFPPADVPYFIIDAYTPNGSALSDTKKVLDFIEVEVNKERLVKAVHANLGHGNPQIFYNWFPAENNTSLAELFVTLKSEKPSEIEATIESIRKRVSGYPGATIILHAFENGPGVEAPIAIRLAGPDLATLTKVAKQLEAKIAATPGTRDVYNPLRLDRTDLNLGVDEAKAAVLGVPAGSIRRMARLAISGEPNGSYRDTDGDAYPVMVRLPMVERQPISVLEKIYIPLENGSSVPLNAVAHPKLQTAPALISRYKHQRSVTVTAQTEPGYLTSAVTTAVLDAIKSVPLPPGYTLTTAGEAEQQSKSLGGLFSIFPVVVFGIFAVLVLEFGNFRETAVVAGVIPLGIVGGLVALFISGNSLSFTAIIGFIALIGIEIKNSILLVDFTAQLRRDGVALKEAIEQAGEVRFLPVLLTSITAIGGLLPLALAGSGLYSPLAWVIIGGLISSTILSRVVTPVMYMALARKDDAV